VDHYTQNPVDPGVQFGEQSFMFPDSIGPTGRWAVFACTSPLSTSRAGRKALSAHWTLDTLKVDAPYLCGRNRLPTFRAYRIERRPHVED
jgi:hypothetical protein